LDGTWRTLAPLKCTRAKNFNRYAVANSDFDVAEGGVLYKLLMRAFPGWYRANSVYALYPFTTVEGTREILRKNGTIDTFDFSEPSFVGPPTPVVTWQGVVNVLNDQEHFKVPCKNPIATLPS